MMEETPSRNLRETLPLLMENIAPASVLVSLPDFEVLAANAAMYRKHGGRFSQNSKLLFEESLLSGNASVNVKLMRRNSCPGFQTASPEEADFEFIRLSRGEGIFIENMLRNKDCDKGIQPFHFSYIENQATGRRNYADPEVLIHAGILSETAADTPWINLIFPEDRPLYEAELKDARVNGGDHELQYRIRNSDGIVISVKDYFSVVPRENSWPVITGTVLSSACGFGDFLAAERQMLQSRLVGGMIHDFKNLLGGIQNIIEWTVANPSDPRTAKALAKTLDYTDQATSLITSALRLGSTKQDPAGNKCVYLQYLIENAREFIRRTVPSSIAVVFDVPDSPPPVIVQEDIVRNVLLNLCVNARDALREKGTSLTVALSSENREGKPVTIIRVSDDGCGMSKAELSSIFEPFYSTKDSGTGLGLWMVKQAMNGFGGGIEVESSPGIGTTFRLVFPAVSHDALLKNQHKHPVKTLPRTIAGFKLNHPRTVLLIEDEPLIRSSVEAWLESLHFDVITAETGTDGYRIFSERKESIDIVIQDFVLPGVRGDELLRKIRLLSPETPVIVSSANPDEERIHTLLESGAYAFLPKPFRMDQLVSLLTNVCRDLDRKIPSAK